MNKNILLYILLVFLIVVNGFFLFNFLGDSKDKPNEVERKRPMDFIVKVLEFDDNQIQQFQKLNEEHHQSIRKYNEDTKNLKDELFTLITAEDVSNTKIDSIIGLLGANEQEREKSIFYNLRDIQSICNDKQKLNFQKIIKDALRKSGNGGPPGGGGANRERPEGRMDGPPLHGRPDGPPPHGRSDGPPKDMPDGQPPTH